jgi:hypothetical protein
MRRIVIGLIGLALILSLIGTTTNYWYQNSPNKGNEGLWVICQRISSSDICNRQPYFKSQGLAVSGLVILTVAFILSIIYFYRPNDRLLAYSIVLTLLGTTLLLIFSYLLYPREIHLRQLGYSIYFMIISSLIVLVTTGLVTFTARTIQGTVMSIHLT